MVLDDILKTKEAKFIKNMGYSIDGSVAGGLAGADLTNLITDSESLISAGSTIGQYILGFGIFLPLHAQDNLDLYKEETGKFKWKVYGKDMLKLTFGLGVLDYFYLIGRPFVNYYFQKEGYGPDAASLISDAICMPFYFLLAVPMAKGLGILRNESSQK